MHTDFLLDGFRKNATKEALVWRDRVFTYAFLLDAVQHWRRRLEQEAVPADAVVSLEADFSPNSVALLLALIERASIIVPLTASVDAKKPEFRAIAQVEFAVAVELGDEASIRPTGLTATHELFLALRARQRPGLVLFSSGSTGKSKAAVHDLRPLLDKFKVPRQCLRTVTFLLFDHIGGVNTLFYTLANGGCLITVESRVPDHVCSVIQTRRAELLPTSPTFLNLLLASEAYTRFDLSSLKLVTYGTEVMPESTLRRLLELFPNTRLQQTYGLSEVGILRSKSRSADSLWVKIGGEGYDTRVVDGMLQIKAQSAMLGYLNAPNPYTEDGWFQTGDAVEVDGDWMRILGRKNEIINVGGEKVYPVELESVLQLLDGVEEVMVTGAPSSLTGHMIVATVKLRTEESLPEFRKRMRSFCERRLPRFMIPHKVEITGESVHGERFKKLRRTF